VRAALPLVLPAIAAPARAGCTRTRRLIFLGLCAAAACDTGAPASSRIVTDSAEADSTAAAATDEVAFRLAGPNDAALIVPVHINGQGPFDFVLDTGATMTCVDASLTTRLALEPEPGSLGFGLDANRPGQVQLIRIDSLRLGNAAAANLQGCVLDLAHIQQAGLDVHGLVGLNFLKEFQITIDFSRERLTLKK
jgi:predicted aspartyl protease